MSAETPTIHTRAWAAVQRLRTLEARASRAEERARIARAAVAEVWDGLNDWPALREEVCKQLATLDGETPAARIAEDPEEAARVLGRARRPGCPRCGFPIWDSVLHAASCSSMTSRCVDCGRELAPGSATGLCASCAKEAVHGNR